MRWLGVLGSVLLLATVGCPARQGSSGADTGTERRPPQDVQLHAEDGWTLAATLYPGRPGDSSGGAVLLVHQLGTDRREWRPLVERLGGARPLVLMALDLRGHGASTTPPAGWPERWEAFGNDPERWRSVEHDVRAAVSHLRNTAGASSIVIVGAGLGASAALLVAAGDASVAGLVLLSPGLAYRGIEVREAMQRYAATGRPALLLAGDQDRPAAEAVPVLAGIGGATVEHEVLGGVREHGVALGNAEPGRWARVEAWVRARLRPGPARVAPAGPEAGAPGV